MPSYFSFGRPVSAPVLVLDDAGKTALHTFLDKGGNFIGVHAASDGLRNTTWFQHEVGEPFLHV